jgi:Lipopolysaccharide-assembly
MKQRSRSFPAGPGFAGVLLLAFLLTGCGYHFTVSGDSAYPAIRTVFVDVFTNRTSEAYAESIYRTAFINRFVQDGRFKLAGSRGEADAVLHGTVKNLLTYPLAYQAGNLSAQNRLALTLELSFEERQSGRILWSNSAFSAVGDYPVTTVGETEGSRKNALIKLANDTAERASRLIMSGF